MGELSVPEADRSDLVHELLKLVSVGVAASIGVANPWAGVAVNFGVELLFQRLPKPLEKRRDDFWQKILESLYEIQAGNFQGFTVESLKDNEAFLTILLQATQVALRNHQKEKLEALRNTVLNAAVSSSLDEDIQMMFLNILETLTPRHLKLLQFLADPPAWTEQNDKDTGDLWNKGLLLVFPDLHENKYLYSQVFRDLVVNGFLVLEPKVDKMSRDVRKSQTLSYLLNKPTPGNFKKAFEIALSEKGQIDGLNSFLQNTRFHVKRSYLTRFGKQFLQFVQDPRTISE